MMAEHGDATVALRRDPIELDDPARADKRLMTVPGIVGAFESEQRALARWNLGNHVVDVVAGPQQPEPAAWLFPAWIHINEDGNDLT